jgi:hypothetical protein
VTWGGKRPNSGPKPRAGAPRRLLLSLRLSEDEMGWLVGRGAPAEVVRDLIAAERRREIEDASPTPPASASRPRR